MLMSADDPDDLATLLSEKLDPTPPPQASFKLLVVEGPEAGSRFLLTGTEPSPVLVGQSAVCGVRLSDAETSRRHAALELVGRRVRISDLGSTNGTFVDGVAIVEAFLSGGELLRFGQSAVSVERLDQVVENAQISERLEFGRLVGASSEMRRLYPVLERLAASTVPLVIEGETGTGKELVAEALHEEGPRRDGPFVVFDCTTLAAGVVESELFGHERGAFTGATTSREGLFELANGGTLFIDEIGDLDLALQPKLLRALERSETRRIGSNRSIVSDVRVVAATRRNLDQEVQAGRFRDDLFHRLAVGRIELPPLRRRRGDVALLARYFWREFGGAPRDIPTELASQWERHQWPGNVRELRNAVARQLALGSLAELPKADPEIATGTDPIENVLALALPLTQARQLLNQEFERRYVERTLALHDGNVRKAARAAGIARRYFQVLRSKTGV